MRTSSSDEQLPFQFTHPGGVRLDTATRDAVRWVVSIHAPGRGATDPDKDPYVLSTVSIHAPGRGATKSINTT